MLVEMEPKVFKKTVETVLIQHGFSRAKGGYWLKGDGVTVVVSLQRSNFSESFYINADFFFDDIPIGPVKVRPHGLLQS